MCLKCQVLMQKNECLLIIMVELMSEQNCTVVADEGSANFYLFLYCCVIQSIAMYHTL